MVGRRGADLPGRPYRLYRGDHVQIRRTIPHPELGALRNGTTGNIIDTGHRGQQLTIRLPDGRETSLDRTQIDQADVRLAYVQHPFLSQGQTTDTAHLIVGDHPTQEGSYVALTRARERSEIYGSLGTLEPDGERDQLALLAEAMSRSEDEAPSIVTPLTHEASIEHEHKLDQGEPQLENVNRLERDDDLGWEP